VESAGGGSAAGRHHRRAAVGVCSRRRGRRVRMVRGTRAAFVPVWARIRGCTKECSSHNTLKLGKLAIEQVYLYTVNVVSFAPMICQLRSRRDVGRSRSRRGSAPCDAWVVCKKLKSVEIRSSRMFHGPPVGRGTQSGGRLCQTSNLHCSNRNSHRAERRVHRFKGIKCEHQ